MNTKDIKTINNLCLRYQDYDNSGEKYAYDIHYTTIHSEGESVKARRQKGADSFSRHIKELAENYDGVTTIIVKDFSGTANNARMLNPPTTIELMDVKTIGHMPKVIIHQSGQSGKQGTTPDFEVLKGLNGLFAGTEFEALGSLAPVAKFIDDKHTIERLREKNDTQAQRIAELERQQTDLSAKYQSLSGRYERLQDDADDMEDELEYYRKRDRRQDKVTSMIGLAGASIAKNFLRQHPAILSAIIPAKQLSGIFSEQEETPEFVPANNISDEQQWQLDEATEVFEWLQTLEKPMFDEVISIVSVMQQNPDYVPLIVRFLTGGKDN